MQWIPMITYADNIPDFGMDVTGRPGSHADRLWLLVKFTTTSGNVCTIKGRAIIEQVRDFCGGVYARSPQVTVYTQDDYHGEHFLHISTDRHEWAPDTRWARLVHDPELLPDLNAILSKEAVDCEEARNWMAKVIALNVLAYATHATKALVQGTDKVGGAYDDLVRTMDGDKLIASEYVARLRPQASTATVRHMTSTESYYVNSTRTEEFRNINSGAMCVGINTLIEYPTPEEWECDCGYYNDEGNSYCYDCEQKHEGITTPRADVPVEITRSFGNASYCGLVDRLNWRNG